MSALVPETMSIWNEMPAGHIIFERRLIIYPSTIERIGGNSGRLLLLVCLLDSFLGKRKTKTKLSISDEKMITKKQICIRGIVSRLK